MDLSNSPRLFHVDAETKNSREVPEVEFSNLGIQERKDIQEWVVANPGILGDDLLIVAKEFNDFDRTNDRLDLLAVDTDGKLVIIELKRDNSGVDAHWQAIKYASYLRQATQQIVVGMLASCEAISETEAEERLIAHTGSDSLENLNSDQRIILVSHRFAREVTSAALWLNDKALGENLITCIQLVPRQHGNALYVQSNTIIPVQGTEPYTIQVGRSGNETSGGGIRARRATRYRFDEITDFVRKVEAKALEALPADLKTDTNSNYARRSGSMRWYALWYLNRPPWAYTQFNYVLHVTRRTSGSFRVVVNFETRKQYLRSQLGYSAEEINEFGSFLRGFIECSVQDDPTFLRPQMQVVDDGAALDDVLVNAAARTLRHMIESVTVKAEKFVDSHRRDATDLDNLTPS